MDKIMEKIERIYNESYSILYNERNIRHMLWNTLNPLKLWAGVEDRVREDVKDG